MSISLTHHHNPPAGSPTLMMQRFLNYILIVIDIVHSNGVQRLVVKFSRRL
jgi:hypothetical protein